MNQEQHLKERFEERRRMALTSHSNAFITISEGFGAITEGRLSGVIFGVKDNIATRGMRLTCASRLMKDYVSPYSATVVERLQRAGALILGKNNMDEFACGSSGERSAFGPTANPLFPGKVPGGSSSGSASAVAEGIVDASIGSDTGGSVRCPSSFCSTVGLKPSYGRVSRYGLVDLSMSLESPAPIVRYGDELLLADIMDTIAGEDERDQRTLGMAAPQFRRRLMDAAIENTMFAIPQQLLASCTREVVNEFDRFVSFLKEKGARLERIQFSYLHLSLPTYYVVMYSEFASAMQRYDGLKFGTAADSSGIESRILESRSQLGEEVRRRILLGTYITSLEGRSRWYEKGMAAKAYISEELASALNASDVLLMPTMPTTPYRFGERLSPLDMYSTDLLTVPANIAGLPSISFPAAPGIGIQLIGKHGSDEFLVSLVNSIREAGWKWKSS
ncbi:MAG: amidase family protein [Methanomassiliicoccales archaeon]